MKPADYVAANREGWEEAAPIHRKQNQERLLASFRVPGYSCLDETETAVLWRIGLAGKDVAQLCCNNGREILSVKNLGARRCVGFEQAPGFIEQARELAAAGNIDCEFLQGDVHAIPRDYDGAFDLVTLTVGVLGWMPDLDAFLAVVARLLRPGGRIFVYECHPILDMLEPGKADAPVAWNHSYFKRDPYVDNDGLDYYGGGGYEAKSLYWFHHKLSDVMMACARNGLDRLERFEELPDHINNSFWNVEKQGPRLPMSYTLVMLKA
ncbi:MAG: class I SAM-dependent methyltransferase [Kiloniellales bacterium]